MPDLMTLHRFNGDEVYRIASATIRVAEYIDEADPELLRRLFHLYLDAVAHPDPIRSCPDTDDSEAHPHASATLVLDPNDIPRLFTQTFAIPNGEPDGDDLLASLYYFEHEPVDNNLIRFSSLRGNKLRVRWTAITDDVNHYDGSKPRTHLEIEAWFTLDGTLALK